MKEQACPLAERLKRESHRICALILNSDLDWVDIAIQINAMRELCNDEAPEKAELFEAVYASRFERLWAQWRAGEGREAGAFGAFGGISSMQADLPDWARADEYGWMRDESEADEDDEGLLS